MIKMSQQKSNDLTFYTSKISPPCRFVHMVLKHLNINCNIKEIDLFGGEGRSAEYLKVNPAGKVPSIKNGDFFLGESRAIACYLCNKFAPDSDLYPKEPEARARVDCALYADTSFVQVMYGYAQPFQVFFLNQKPDHSDDSKVQKAFALQEEILSKQKFLAGDHMTLADLSAINALGILDMCNYSNFSKFPHLKNWIDTMKKLPYYDECTGNPVREVGEIFRQKIKNME